MPLTSIIVVGAVPALFGFFAAILAWAYARTGGGPQPLEAPRQQPASTRADHHHGAVGAGSRA